MKSSFRIALYCVATCICIAVVICRGQTASQPNSDAATVLYQKLSVIASNIRDSNLGKNSKGEPKSKLTSEAKHTFDESPLSGQEKYQFVIANIQNELLEIEKREALLRILLRQAVEQTVKGNDLLFFTNYLTGEHVNKESSRDSLIRCLVQLEQGGTSVFANPTNGWASVLEWNLTRRFSATSLLRNHMLEIAKQDNWNPYGDGYFPSWNTSEAEALNDEILAAQKFILARRFVDEKIRRGASSARDSR